MLPLCKAKQKLPRSLKAAPFAFLGASQQRLAQNNTFGVLVTSTQAEWQITPHVNQTPSAAEWQRQARAKQRAAAQTGFVSCHNIAAVWVAFSSSGLHSSQDGSDIVVDR